MAGVELVLFLLAVSVALRMLAERLTIPYSALLVVGGLLLALLPGLPRVELAPDVLFLVFVPPLLYWGAVGFPLRDFRREFGPITRLAVLMVLVSTAAVAVVAHALDPAFTWAAAFALGAIVAPPDPVAVLSVMRSVGVPRAVESTLEGEGLLNDATALIAYRVAVAAAVTGVFSPWRAAAGFLTGGAGGIAIGIGVGVLVLRALSLTRSVPVAENTVSLLAPYVAYLAADLLGTSGVLAVVAAAMTVARGAPGLASPIARLQNTAMWTVTTFLLESLIFILVGLELSTVTRALERYSLLVMLRDAALLSLCIVLVRIVWVMPSTYLARMFGRWLRGSHEALPPWRQILFVAWAGVRGGESLVIALALPLTTAAGTPFPAREQILFITFGVIFATLVLQGPTLAPVARRLGLCRGAAADDEEAHARLSVAEAGLRALSQSALAGSPYPEVVRYLRQRHLQRARRWAARDVRDAHHGAGDAIDHMHFVTAPSNRDPVDEGRAAEYRRIRAAMIGAEQERLIRMRDTGEIGDDTMRRVLRDLDLESLLLDTQEPVSESVSDVPAAIGAATGD